ncbi:hypothetical protein [Endozoicomonas sp. GU-1]|uniref:hypothetical protein n=1 Tax=Endozoicomonas sp. GU-1 TaxID=3009078 RepID=UPI0022B4E25C|nr:hypothetical protein [Endozoicomonas sp. GU-1]WBA85362.1 hypothetical protein O3276_19250 [Endozoicomonas sp. GU-1]
MSKIGGVYSLDDTYQQTADIVVNNHIPIGKFSAHSPGSTMGSAVPSEACLTVLLTLSKATSVTFALLVPI